VTDGVPEARAEIIEQTSIADIVVEGDRVFIVFDHVDLTMSPDEFEEVMVAGQRVVDALKRRGGGSL